MKVLVTGAHGFVGRHLVRALKNSDHTVVTTGTNEEPVTPDEEYLRADLTQPEEVARIKFADIDGVVHLAGLAAVGPSFSNPLEYYRVNLGAQTNLLEEIVKQQANPKVIIVSSASLYAETSILPLTETSAVAPGSPYGISKLAQEQIASYYNLRGLSCIVARPFTHIGPGQGTGFLVSDIAQRLYQLQHDGGDTLTVGNITTRRDYTDVRDIARAYISLLLNGHAGEIYNICSGTARSGEDVIMALAKQINLRIHTEVNSKLVRPTDIPVVVGSYAKLLSDTGWKPEINFEQTLSDVLADWKERT